MVEVVLVEGTTKTETTEVVEATVKEVVVVIEMEVTVLDEMIREVDMVSEEIQEIEMGAIDHEEMIRVVGMVSEEKVMQTEMVDIGLEGMIKGVVMVSDVRVMGIGMEATAQEGIQDLTVMEIHQIVILDHEMIVKGINDLAGQASNKI